MTRLHKSSAQYIATIHYRVIMCLAPAAALLLVVWINNRWMHWLLALFPTEVRDHYCHVMSKSVTHWPLQLVCFYVCDSKVKELKMTTANHNRMLSLMIVQVCVWLIQSGVISFIWIRDLTEYIHVFPMVCVFWGSNYRLDHDLSTIWNTFPFT